MNCDDTLIWYRDLSASNNKSFMRLFFDKSRYLVLKGGGGSGKSIFAGRKVLERATTEPNHRILVVRKVGKTIRESCFEQLRGQISTYYPRCLSSVNSTDMTIEFRNGSKILFSGLDDVEKLKSIYDITMIWIEEASEISEADFNQLDIRLRTVFPFYLQMILSFNPISITHWLKARFFDRHDERATVHESTYKDNRFLTDDAIKTLEAFKETDEYYYSVYCLGEWGVTGKTVFDGKKLSDRLQSLPTPFAIGHFDCEMTDDFKIKSYRFSDEQFGSITIYREPINGARYYIGADTSGDGSDYFAAHVLDDDGRQVAVLHHQYDEDTFTRQIYCLGRYYNDALLGIESNFSTYPNKILSMIGYPRLYVREREDTFDGTIKKSFGFRTDSVTRPLIIADLVRIVREHTDLISDRKTIEEMLTFVRNEKMRAEAEQGAHDDLVMSLAIAYYIRGNQTLADEPRKKFDISRLPADVQEDYYNAPEEMKRIIEERLTNA